jgi:hypothetical protein|tara:strand:+ start:587 stop:856 length:270 start_codon:yes stop_codon:yes gene_type:complete
MVVGDVVNGLQAGGDFTFQPAASVQIAITYFGSWGAASQLTNGVIVAYIREFINTAGQSYSLKLMINNTNYVKMLADTNGSMYSGVQIK